MTLGWGFEGTAWAKPVFVALIHKERYTWELLKTTNVFTVSFPKQGDMKEALLYYGRTSGWDEDKHSPGLVTLKNSETIDCPYVDACEEHYECRLLYVCDLSKELFIPENMPPILHEGTGGALHQLCFGEILNKS